MSIASLLCTCLGNLCSAKPCGHAASVFNLLSEIGRRFSNTTCRRVASSASNAALTREEKHVSALPGSTSTQPDSPTCSIIAGHEAVAGGSVLLPPRATSWMQCTSRVWTLPPHDRLHEEKSGAFHLGGHRTSLHVRVIASDLLFFHIEIM